MKKTILCAMLVCMVLAFSGCGRAVSIAERIITAASEAAAAEDEPEEAIYYTPEDTSTDAPQSPTQPEAAANPVDAALSPAQIFEYNADAVFTIYTSFDGYYFFPVGSGFFVCESGIAVTNHHVVVNWPVAMIRTHSGTEHEVLGYYYYYLGADLAVIQVSGGPFPYLSIGDSDALRIGDSVFAIGSPLGYHNTFSTGVVSRFDDVAVFDIYRVYGMIQFTAPISGGSSGGALLNDRGQVIGITTAAYTTDVAQAINFAVPIARVDLGDVEAGVFLDLPVGSVMAMYDFNLAGTWLWSEGHYTFYVDGSGHRDWSGNAAYFGWHIAGPVLFLNFADGNTEQWQISEINENEITIGGAHFIRTDNINIDVNALIGSWDWDHGVYVFNANGSGSRVWSGVLATFEWELVNSMLFLYLDGFEDEYWTVTVTSHYEVNIGGARFTRRD